MEKPKHIEAFNVYYLLGDGRSIPKLRQELERRWKDTGYKIPSERTLYRWSITYKWQERIKEREQQEKALLKQESEQALKDLVYTKADYRKEIKRLTEMIDSVIAKAYDKLEIRSVYDLVSLLKIKIELAKLDMQLMAGEPQTNEIHVRVVRVSAYKTPEGKIIEVGEEEEEQLPELPETPTETP